MCCLFKLLDQLPHAISSSQRVSFVIADLVNQGVESHASSVSSPTASRPVGSATRFETQSPLDARK
jgi:hypothetical protein